MHVNDSYGVVCVVTSVIKCSICRFGTHTCVHVQHVRSMLENPGESFLLLKSFAKDLYVSLSTKVKYTPTCLDKSLIQMNFSETQQHSIKSCTQQRLNIVDGISYLLSDDVLCALCNTNNCSEPVFVREW